VSECSTRIWIDPAKSDSIPARVPKKKTAFDRRARRAPREHTFTSA
jgi:hypothetical protein